MYAERFRGSAMKRAKLAACSATPDAPEKPGVTPADRGVPPALVRKALHKKSHGGSKSPTRNQEVSLFVIFV